MSAQGDNGDDSDLSGAVSKKCQQTAWKGLVKGLDLGIPCIEAISGEGAQAGQAAGSVPADPSLLQLGSR